MRGLCISPEQPYLTVIAYAGRRSSCIKFPSRDSRRALEQQNGIYSTTCTVAVREFSQELGQEIDFRSLQTLGWKYIN
jgi:hypothetical protein